MEVKAIKKAIYNNQDISKLYVGDILIFPFGSGQRNDNVRGKFTDYSTSADWWYWANGSQWDETNKTDITKYVNPETKEFAIDIGTPTTLQDLFSQNGTLERIDDLPVDENITNLAEIFMYCTALNFVNTEGWNTQNVSSMNNSFIYCSNLNSIDVSEFNVGLVYDMSNMFAYSGINELDLSNWNTDCLQYIPYMFQGCSQLWSLNLSNWNIVNLYQSDYLFQGCSNLTDLYLCNWSFNQYANPITDYMFYECYSLQNIYGPIYNINFDLDLSSSSNLTYDSINVIIEGLYDFNGGTGDSGDNIHYLYLHPNAFGLIELDFNIISLANAKGWTIVSQS